MNGYSVSRNNAMLDYDSLSVVSAETDEFDHLGFHEASHHGVSFDFSEDIMATPDVIRSGDTLLAAVLSTIYSLCHSRFP